MTFSSIPGSFQSQPGQIVPGLASSFGNPAFGFIVHVLSASTVRVKYDVPVNELTYGPYNDSRAINKDLYSLSVITTSSTYLPEILEVVPYELDNRQYELKLNNPLTRGSIYSLSIKGVSSLDGVSFVSSNSRNFTANVPDGPQCVGAYLGRESEIVMIFDRDVGDSSSYSSSPAAIIYDSSDPSSFKSLSPVTWNLYQAKNSLVWSVPEDVPSCDGWSIKYSDVYDISNNTISGYQYVDVKIADEITRPLNHDKISDIVTLRSFTTDITVNQNVIDSSFANIRTYFNVPPNVSDVQNRSNWTITQLAVHKVVDTDSVSSPNATDLSSLITLSNEIKSKFNNHSLSEVFHYSSDRSNTVSIVSEDLETAIELINLLSNSLYLHRISDTFHQGADPIGSFIPSVSSDLTSACTSINSIKAAFNAHVGHQNVLIDFIDLYRPDSAIDVSWANTTLVQPDGPYVWHVDLRVRALSAKARYSIIAENIHSSDNNSVLSNSPITVESLSTSGHVLNVEVFPDSSISITVDKPITNYSILEVGTPSQINIDEVRYLTSLQQLTWVFLSLANVFEIHRSQGPSIHFVPDTVNRSPQSVPSLPLSSLISYANELFSQFTSHRSTKIFHYGKSDFSPLSVEPAYDYLSLVKLAEALVESLNSHVTNSYIHGQSQNLVSVLIDDRISVPTGYMKNWTDGDSLGFVNMKYSTISKNPLLTATVNSFTSVSPTFKPLGKLPYESAVLPVSGIQIDPDGARYVSDQVELYLSKMMDDSIIDPITITGGTVSILKRQWYSRTKAILVVKDMVEESYTISATGLKDLAGNEVP
jgi:hypothetical protein